MDNGNHLNNANNGNNANGNEEDDLPVPVGPDQNNNHQLGQIGPDRVNDNARQHHNIDQLAAGNARANENLFFDFGPDELDDSILGRVSRMRPDAMDRYRALLRTAAPRIAERRRQIAAALEAQRQAEIAEAERNRLFRLAHPELFPRRPEVPELPQISRFQHFMDGLRNAWNWNRDQNGDPNQGREPRPGPSRGGNTDDEYPLPDAESSTVFVPFGYIHRDFNHVYEPSEHARRVNAAIDSLLNCAYELPGLLLEHTAEMFSAEFPSIREVVESLVHATRNLFTFSNEPDHRRPFTPSELALVPARPLEFEELLEGIECAICFEGLHVGDLTSRLPCRHIYHNICLRGWLERRGDCPLCRAFARSVETEVQAIDETPEDQGNA